SGRRTTRAWSSAAAARATRSSTRARSASWSRSTCSATRGSSTTASSTRVASADGLPGPRRAYSGAVPDTEVPIRDESIRLGQLLKLAGVVDDGGVARAVIADGGVTVDGEVETRRGAQVRLGQVVRLGEHTITLTAGG